MNGKKMTVKVLATNKEVLSLYAQLTLEEKIVVLDYVSTILRDKNSRKNAQNKRGKTEAAR